MAGLKASSSFIEWCYRADLMAEPGRMVDGCIDSDLGWIWMVGGCVDSNLGWMVKT